MSSGNLNPQKETKGTRNDKCVDGYKGLCKCIIFSFLPLASFKNIRLYKARMITLYSCYNQLAYIGVLHVTIIAQRTEEENGAILE